MAQPIAAQAIVNAQNQVELGKIPLWYGDRKKDAFTAEHYIERIELLARPHHGQVLKH